ncbi:MULTISPECIES: sensor histidine kinase [Nocardia]|uniref:histidine kinase n=2 Tax=Nocardia TaxID=1817 RepID=A0A2T2Z0I9_9NOCA|nr:MULTISPECIES: PAS domain-containing sensor histidine kinase [Nocardia]MBF6149026.1 histidine kinase N-terminal domain-containing protein [Nocardia nova]MBF6450989.1 histidine kinase N-terminal domain-containing protein [Nocardia elegans]MDN2501371.1 ATPase [Nocardia nova]PSR61292.1 ATPase [Nocardia nova]
MSTLSDLLAEHTDLPGAAVDHLQRVVGDWQLLADLSFADLQLWVGIGPVTDGADVVCVAQCRPTTAPTVQPDDLVGSLASRQDHPQIFQALSSGEIVRVEGDGESTGVYHPTPARVIREGIPVRCGTDVIAVLGRDTDMQRSKVRGSLEHAYMSCADDLCQMIADGTFPTLEDRTGSHSSPRAGDGFIRLDTDGLVVYASPNALSAYHRMGLQSELAGQDLAQSTRSLITDPFDAQEVVSDIQAALAGKSGRRMEVEARGATVLLRTLVLRPHGELAGVAVLVRDVTEVKRRDRALLSKDATIREIHHRVKNNLQTVAALLRLQARRTENEEARVALTESVRRVTSIASVHEMLSMSVDEEVDLDEVVDRLLPIMADVATVHTARIKVRRDGSLGVFSAERATPLVMVLTELVQNAIEHAFDAGENGTVTIRSERSARWLDVIISDDGRGLPEGFSLEGSDRLGLQIVRTLVTAELGGSIGLHPGADIGTDAVLRVPLGRRNSR